MVAKSAHGGTAVAASPPTQACTLSMGETVRHFSAVAVQCRPQISRRRSDAGRVTFLLCRHRTLQLCGGESGVMQVMEFAGPGLTITDEPWRDLERSKSHVPDEALWHRVTPRRKAVARKAATAGHHLAAMSAQRSAAGALSRQRRRDSAPIVCLKCWTRARSPFSRK